MSAVIGKHAKAAQFLLESGADASLATLVGGWLGVGGGGGGWCPLDLVKVIYCG
jgi:hypothetical protein